MRGGQAGAVCRPKLEGRLNLPTVLCPRLRHRSWIPTNATAGELCQMTNAGDLPEGFLLVSRDTCNLPTPLLMHSLCNSNFVDRACCRATLMTWWAMRRIAGRTQ
jgi:hypothetical protein